MSKLKENIMKDKTKLNLINAVIVVVSVVITFTVFAVVNNPQVAENNDIAHLKQDLNK
jgi:hypothetical protein